MKKALSTAKFPILTAFIICIHLIATSQTSTQFQIVYSKEVSTAPIAGRVLLLLSSDTAVDPDIPNPYQPFITFGMEFKDWYPGEKLALSGENVDGFMSTMDELQGYYSLRVLVDTDSMSSILFRDGIIYSDKMVFHTEPGKANVVDVDVKNVLSGMGFIESDSIKLLQMESRLLSDFYGSPTYIEAAVILPDSYSRDTKKIYPVVFVLPGWGSTHVAVTLNDFQQKRYGMSGYGEEKIYVFLNQDCRYGYHVFADSENNGPRATSFITEFIPNLEKHYRVEKDAGGRFLVGQSSGGWGALWLMVNYPDTFGIAWAGSPDPVDFRDFLGRNLYKKDANLFHDKNGNLTKAVRHHNVDFTIKDWSEMETATGEGGQYQSFESVFGGRDNKRPQQLFDRQTGKIFPEAVDHWKAYDINLVILEKSKTLKEKLQDKINIVVAANDDFYLDGAVRLLKNTLDSLDIKSNILLLEDGGHNTWSDEIRKEMHKRMDEI